MKVLFVNTNDSSGGAARAAMRIMRGVQQSGVEVQMFVKDKYSESPDVIPLSTYAPSSNWLFDIFKWVIQKFKNRYHMFKWHPYKLTKQDVFMSDLRHTNIHGALQKLDYDIVHLHWINNRFLDIRELAKIHKPIVWTLHDSWPFCGVCHYFLDCVGYQQQCGSCPQLGSHDSNDLSYQIWKKKKAVFDTLDLHIVTPSRWLADCATRSSLFAGRDIRVIPNCLDTNVFRPLSQTEVETNLSAAQKQNAVVSRVLREVMDKRIAKPLILFGAMNAANDRIKGFASLLSALQILDQQEFEANLMVFGANETELPMRFEHITVTFLGYVSDTSLLVTLYNMADVMVVPSLTENLSCAIMEALSCGTPVCCFNIGGNGDMVEHRVNGYLAKERGTDMAAGIKDCIAHSVEWSVAARESVVKKYSVEVVAKQYSNLYKVLVR